jgi:hypothetical protein
VRTVGAALVAALPCRGHPQGVPLRRTNTIKDAMVTAEILDSGK